LIILQEIRNHQYKHYNIEKIIYKEINGKAISWECKNPNECDYHCFNIPGHCIKGVVLKIKVKDDEEYWEWRTKQIELHYQRKFDIANKVYNKREKYFVNYRIR
jgi:hypothetical protein